MELRSHQRIRLEAIVSHQRIRRFKLILRYVSRSHASTFHCLGLSYAVTTLVNLH